MELDKLDLNRPLDLSNTRGFIQLCLNCRLLVPTNGIHGFKVEGLPDDTWAAKPGVFQEETEICACKDPQPYICVLACEDDHHWASHAEWGLLCKLMGAHALRYN